eukprot:gb/GECH01006708.1/.p1 GENE.gb/GECH01006708.1/~~gb/GECH01006708.1/.p1  ORF type:complete len:395 (+),score=72.71 gb/GECH01006708.1/:1-1185(+)
MDVFTTPEEKQDFNLRLILQYLNEHGFTSACSALEEEAGWSYDSKPLDHGSQLEHIVSEYQHMMSGLEMAPKESEVELIGNATGRYVRAPERSLDNLHQSNVLCIACHPSNPEILLSGAANSSIIISNVNQNTTLRRMCTPHSGGILDVAWLDTETIIASSMDGGVRVYDSNTGEQLDEHKEHGKYVVRTRVHSNSGQRVVTGSYDGSIVVWERQGRGLHMVGRWRGNGAVEGVDVHWERAEAVVSVRGSNYLHYLDIGLPSGVETLYSINMNANGDDFVSFTGLDVCVSYDGRIVAVATDRDRVIVFEYGSDRQIRNLYGTKTNPLKQAKVQLDQDASYLYATAGNDINVYELETQSQVHQLKAHSNVVRCIDIDKTGRLLSGSFDKSIVRFE